MHFTSSRSISSATTYSYYAYAINGLGLEGQGDVVIFTTPTLPSPEAEADYEFYNIGAPTGGTLFSSTTGAYGDWSGGTNILPDDENPTSARCGADDDDLYFNKRKNKNRYLYWTLHKLVEEYVLLQCKELEHQDVQVLIIQ